MKRFRIYWLSGKVEEIVGNDITDAFRRAGYGGGAVHAVDFFEEISTKK